MREIVLYGVVDRKHGFHIAANNLRPVSGLISIRMGLGNLVDGTLNVRLNDPYIIQHPEARIEVEEYKIGGEFLKLQRCKIKGTRGVIVRPNLHEEVPGWGHGPAHLEIMGEVHFCESIGLEHGQQISVEVEGSDSWWAI